ncbi:hypothetical protein BDF21DRAFT_405485 [Thamnidium elegans]|nr:hypothetical protein BDF21DRAFT_405485 [Thamnidium elegans]
MPAYLFSLRNFRPLETSFFNRLHLSYLTIINNVNMSYSSIQTLYRYYTSLIFFVYYQTLCLSRFPFTYYCTLFLLVILCSGQLLEILKNNHSIKIIK